MSSKIKNLLKMGGVICIFHFGSLSAQLRMSSTGNIGVGTTVLNAERLYVKGNAVFSNADSLDKTKANPKIIGGLSPVLPSYTWTDELGTGLGKLDAKKLGLFVGEVPHVTLTEKTFRISPAGSQPMPSTISVPGYSGSYPGNFRLYVTGELEQPTALFNHFHNPDKLNLGVVSLSNQATTLTFTSGIRRATIGGEGGNLVYEPTFGVYASGEVYARTYYPSSDSTLKENIQPMNLAGKARDIETFSYSWKSDTILHQTHYGFIAQQVQLHVPNLVSSRDSILAIDLTGLLALLYDDHKLLVSQVDSMNQMILSLNDQLAVCCAMNQQARLAPPQTADEQTETLTPVERLSNASKNTESQNARLDQNRPNPFGKRTEIPYFIPKGKSAKLWITDLNGKKLLSFTLEPGENTLEIKNHHLSSGIYLYNLVLDGEVVATRKMTIE